MDAPNLNRLGFFEVRKIKKQNYDFLPNFKMSTDKILITEFSMLNTSTPPEFYGNSGK